MADFKTMGLNVIRWLILAGKNLSVNSVRRLRLLAKNFGIWRQKRVLAAHYYRFGHQVFQQLEAGEVNPLLREDIKDQIGQLKALEEKLAQQREAADQVRQLIKATSYRLPAAPAAAPEPQSVEPETSLQEETTSRPE